MMVMGLAMVLAQLIAGGHFSGQLRLHFDVYSIIFIHFKSNAFRQFSKNYNKNLYNIQYCIC